MSPGFPSALASLRIRDDRVWGRATAAFLLLCVIEGILWADRAEEGLSASGAGGVVALLTLLLGLVASLASGRDDRGRVGLRIGALSLAGTICVAIGFQTLDRRLERARIDAGRAAVAARDGIRIAEARVRSRRPGRWGDELLLVGVRAVDGGSPLPRRVRLGLAMRTVDDSTERADRDASLLRPGARARLGLKVSPLRGRRNPGTIDRERAAARRGVAARARLAKLVFVLEHHFNCGPAEFIVFSYQYFSSVLRGTRF